MVALVLLGVMAWLAFSLLAAWALTHRTRPPFPEVPPAGFSGLRLHSQDGQELGAWYQPGGGDLAVILLHHHHTCRTAMLGRVPPYQALGASLLLVSMRAHGDSSGTFDDVGWSARKDVLSAVTWMHQQGHHRLILDGNSLGAVASIFAAQEVGDQVGGYILECPYIDLLTAVDNRTHLFLPGPLARVATLGLTLTAPAFLDAPQISPLQHMRDIPEKAPILMMAGALDRYSPPEQVAALAEQVPTHCRLVVFPQGGHADLRRDDTPLYDGLVQQFCRDLP